MRKILFIILFLFVLNLLIAQNRAWNNFRNYKQILTVQSLISYVPGVVNYRYHDESKGYYYLDCFQWNHMFNFYPCLQIGTILSYKWLWGVETFVFSNLYRIFGFNIDIYNLTLQFSLCDIGYSWYKYEWNKEITGRNNQWCFLLNFATIHLNYRIMLNKYVDIFISVGYTVQMIFDNKIYFPNSNVDVYMFLEHDFSSGIGFRFYTRNFK